MSGLLRLLVLLPLGLALAGCAAVGPGASSAAPGAPTAERPIYKLGDKWILADGVYELVRIEEDIYVFAASPFKEFHLSKDLTIAKIVKGDAIHEFYPPPKLRWPLEIGKWGQSEVSWSYPQGPKQRAWITWQIDAYEDVQVPAGTFKAFRIVHNLRAGVDLRAGGGMWNRDFYLWYSPEARQLIKGEGPELGRSNQFTIVALDRPVVAPLAIRLTEPEDQATSTAA